MKSGRTFWERITTRYLLVIRNEQNLAEKSTIGFTYGRLAALAFAIGCCVFVFSFLLSKTILNQWFDPRHEQMQQQMQFIALAQKVDSLSDESENKNRLIQNLQRIILGQEPVTGQQVSPVANPVNAEAPISLELSLNDSLFRKEFESTQLGLIAVRRDNPVDETIFFPPISGIVTSSFNAGESHFGVDVVCKTNEPVKCVADGIVTLSSWTQDAGYVMIVQHQNDLMSIYKHNAELLKKVGSFVNAGDIISIVGNSGEITDGPHLHFELWYNGNALNPEEFVTF